MKKYRIKPWVGGCSGSVYYPVDERRWWGWKRVSKNTQFTDREIAVDWINGGLQDMMRVSYHVTE